MRVADISKCYGLDAKVYFLAERSEETSQNSNVRNGTNFADVFHFGLPQGITSQTSHAELAFESANAELRIRFLSKDQKVLFERRYLGAEILECNSAQSIVYYSFLTAGGEGGRSNRRFTVTVSRTDHLMRVNVKEEGDSPTLIFSSPYEKSESWANFRPYAKQ